MTIQRTLNSVQAQNIKPQYHIFIDYKSKDSTIEKINEYKNKNPKIKAILIHQNSHGIYKAWNEALIYLLSEVNSDHYISIINSDDWFVDDYIKKISPYKGYDLIAGSCIAYFDNYSLLRPCRSLKFLPFFMPIIDPSLCVKAAVFRNIGLYRERFKVAGDHDFIYRAFEMGCKFKILDEILVNVEMGGFAYQNREIAFDEQFILSKERSLLPLPELALIYRKLRIPRMRLFDFL